MKKMSKYALLILVVLAAMPASAAKADSISAVVAEVENSAYMLQHEYYGNTHVFSELVQQMLVQGISNKTGIDAVAAADTDKQEAAVNGFEKVSRKKEYDYIIHADVREANVKKSYRFVGAERYRKFSLWCSLDIKVEDRITGRQIMSGIYEGKHEVMLKAPGTKAVDAAARPGIEPAGRDFEYFAGSVAGAPFTDAVDSFLNELLDTTARDRTVLASRQ